MMRTTAVVLAILALLPTVTYAGRDYYDILDVPRDAHVSIIKKSYRRLARLYHPDKNPGDAKMEAKFKDISKAYEVLSDKEKRQRYDSFGEQGVEGGGHDMGGGFGGFHGGNGFHGGSEFHMNIDPSMFEGMFGGFGGFDSGSFGGGHQGGFGGGRRRYRQQQRKLCFHNKVCENGSCFMVKECKS